MPRARSTGRRLIKTKRTRRKKVKCPYCGKLLDGKLVRIKLTAKTRKRK